MIIEAVNISKNYENHRALDQVSLKIPKGSIFGLLGPNGAGKTSLIRIITRITMPDFGNVNFNGEPILQRHIYRMGYLPEERGLYKKMKVGEQLLYFAQLKGLSEKQSKQNLKSWIDRFEMKDWLGKKVEELSKGMQQKVQFVATVIHNPELLILDEPFSGFDPVNAQQITEEILRLKKQGTSIIFSTHRMDSVEQLCDEIALINQSKLVLNGKVNDIKNQFKKNVFSVKYLGNLATDDENPFYKIISTNEAASAMKESIISLNEHSTKNAITHLLNQVEIQSFTELLPSMEEIFIQAVQKQTEGNTHE